MDRARPIGILAGGGALPVEIARSIVARGGEVQIVSLAGESDQDFNELPHTRVGWGEVGRLIATFKSAGVADLVIIGAVTRPDLRRLRPDLGLIERLPKIIRIITAGGDDGVLRRVVGVLEDEGFRVIGPDQVAPELVCRAGPVAGPPSTGTIRADAALGFEVVAALGRFDIGQAVVVAGGRVIAIEGAEGTDRLLRRLAGNPAAAGGVLVKRPKPSQDLRVDLPTIGPDTVTRAHTAGLAAIMVEADRVIRAGRDDLSARAERLGITVEAIGHAGSEGQDLGGGPRSGVARGWLPWSARGRRERVRIDAERGAAVSSVLARYGCGHAVVVARRHVLAAAGQETVRDVLDRVSGLRQWGDGRRRIRRGVLVIGEGARSTALDDGLLTSAAAAGLEAVAYVDPEARSSQRLAMRARAMGLEIVVVDPRTAGRTGTATDA